MKKLKTKNGDAQKKQSSREVRGVSPEAGRESMVGKIRERGRSWGGSERERELWMVRVVSWQSEKMWQEHEQAEQRQRGWNEVDWKNQEVRYVTDKTAMVRETSWWRQRHKSGDAEADSERLGWGEEWAPPWEGVRPSPEKKVNFALEMACFDEFSSVFF